MILIFPDGRSTQSSDGEHSWDAVIAVVPAPIYASLALLTYASGSETVRRRCRADLPMGAK